MNEDKLILCFIIIGAYLVIMSCTELFKMCKDEWRVIKPVRVSIRVRD